MDDIILITAVREYTDLQVLCMRNRYTMEGLLNPVTRGDASANSIRSADEGKYMLLN